MASGAINTNIVKLWDNATPTPTGQTTLNLDLSKYKFIRIYFRTLESELTIGSDGFVSADVEVNGKSVLAISYGNIDTAYYAHMYVRWVSATTSSVTWSVAYDKSLNSSTAGGAINNALIPYTIYGIV